MADLGDPVPASEAIVTSDFVMPYSITNKFRRRVVAPGSATDE